MKRHRIQRWISRLNRIADRWWYDPMMALLSASDAYLLFVPNELLLVTGVLANRKRWFKLSLWMTFGSAIGASSLAALVRFLGNTFFSHWITSVLSSGPGSTARDLVHGYGMWGLAAMSLGPLPQHGAVILVGLMHLEIWKVFLGVLLGRSIKYVGIAVAAAHSPELLVRWRLIPEWVLEAEKSGPQDRKRSVA